MTTIYIKKEDLPERIENDVYPTERDLVEKALMHVMPTMHVSRILDIGAGDGVWGLTAKNKVKEARLWGIDIVGEKPDGFDTWSKGNYLDKTYLPQSFNLIVSNPPYYIAEQIIRKAWKELAPGGEIVMLLRLAFMAGVDRSRGLWQEIHPYKVGVVSRRPSFYGRGTNGTDYGVFYWHKTIGNTCYAKPGEWKTFLLMHSRDPMPKKEKKKKLPKFTQLELPQLALATAVTSLQKGIDQNPAEQCIVEYIEGRMPSE